jgi:hypothetical protein
MGAAGSITEPMEAAATAFFRDKENLDEVPSKADNNAMLVASIIGNAAKCARLRHCVVECRGRGKR